MLCSHRWVHHCSSFIVTMPGKAAPGPREARSPHHLALSAAGVGRSSLIPPAVSRAPASPLFLTFTSLPLISIPFVSAAVGFAWRGEQSQSHGRCRMASLGLYNNTVYSPAHVFVSLAFKGDGWIILVHVFPQRLSCRQHEALATVICEHVIIISPKTLKEMDVLVCYCCHHRYYCYYYYYLFSCSYHLYYLSSCCIVTSMQFLGMSGARQPKASQRTAPGRSRNPALVGEP